MTFSTVTVVDASAGVEILVDDVSGQLLQCIKPFFGKEGSATAVSADNPMPVVRQNGEYDAFGRQRVSLPVTLFDFKQTSDMIDALVWSTLATGSGTGTFRTNESAFRLEVGTGNGDEFVRQSKSRPMYQPGKSMLYHFTCSLGANDANVLKRIGFFDNDNGLFFQKIGGTASVGLRSKVTGSVVDTLHDQSTWNVDKMDGTGPSGITIDWTKSQIFVVDYQWLGVGRVRFCMVVDGVLRIVHELMHTNTLSTVYMSYPNLPARAEIKNLATTTGSSYLDQICVNAVLEGGDVTPQGVRHSVNRDVTALANDDTAPKPLISIRLDNTKAIYSQLRGLTGSIMTSSKSNFLWEAYLNPVFASPIGHVWGSVPFSAVEYDTTETSDISGGLLLDSGYVADSAESVGYSALPEASELSLGRNLDGSQDVLAIAVRNLAAATESYYGSVTWLEVS